MAKTLQEFREEGGGWVVRVTAGGKEFLYRGGNPSTRGNAEEGKGKDRGYAIRFKIPFDVLSDTNIGEVSFYNLEMPSVRKFRRGTILKLEAGYEPIERHLEPILRGTIEDVIVQEKVKYERLFTVQVADAGDVWPVKVTSKQWLPGVMATTVAKDLIAELGLPIGKFAPRRSDIEYYKGLSICGAIRPELEMVVRDMESKLHISRGKVYILDPLKGIPTGITLERENGLLAIKPAMALPADLQYVKKWTADEEPVIYEIQALLTPKLWADSIFKVKSESLSGRFRVISGVHFCDGRSMLTKVRVAKAD